jgi:hypothetical protein
MSSKKPEIALLVFSISLDLVSNLLEIITSKAYSVFLQNNFFGCCLPFVLNFSYPKQKIKNGFDASDISG